MTLLPLRALPVNDAHDGPLTMRVNVRPSGSAYVYVRRESDKKTWLCKVRTLQEILAPSQQARSLSIVAVVMCLYNGVAYDTYDATPAYSGVPLELRRREVAFAQPETWTDDGYRLTMRVAVRGSTLAPAAPSMSNHTGDSHAMEAIPVVDIAEDDVVFGLNFSATTFSLDFVDPQTTEKKRVACLRTVGVAFPGAYLNFMDGVDPNFVRTVNDGLRIVYDGYRSRASNEVEVTLDVVHAKDPAMFVLAVNSQAVRVHHTVTYQPYPGGDIFHTITQYAFKVTARSLLQVIMLPGSAAALAGSSVTIREPTIES